MKELFSCWKCIYSSDKCKNKRSDQYDKYIEDIEECSFLGKVDNSYYMKYKLEESNGR